MDITKQTILVAHSLGGFLSIYVADRFPIKKLVMLNPAGILPTLGEWGYYWGLFFKKGLPTSAFQFSTVSSELLIYLCRWWWKDADHVDHVKTEFWLSFLSNPANEGRQILQRLITFTPFYSYWNTPAILVLMDVYKKVPTSICFGVDDTIIPSHIGSFLGRLTQGEIMIHNIKNASHNPCCNIQCMVEFLVSVVDGKNMNITTTNGKQEPMRKSYKIKNTHFRGYSYPSFIKTKESCRNVYHYLITHTICSNYIL
jgi:pimeloyl-ACP methyl ester carboxylesterase